MGREPTPVTLLIAMAITYLLCRLNIQVWTLVSLARAHEGLTTMASVNIMSWLRATLTYVAPLRIKEGGSFCHLL